jgi:hypothetical protein
LGKGVFGWILDDLLGAAALGWIEFGCDSVDLVRVCAID